MKFAESRPIKNYCLGIYDGPHATPKESGDGPVFLGIKNITDDGALDLSEIRHVSEEEYPRWIRRVTPQAGDVVFTYEATLHRYAIIPDGFRGCLGRRVALVRPDPGQVDSRYLLYFFLSSTWRQVIESNVITGATVDRVPLEKFPTFPAALPQLRIQQQITDILSAYDDLIENNRRRMALLEEAARQLYREWFIRLRFPGHEHTRTTNGVPERWERLRVVDLVSFTIGGGWGADEHSAKHTEPAYVIRGTDLPSIKSGAFGGVPFRFHEPRNLSKRELLPGDIILEISNGNIRNIGRSYRIERSVIESFDGKVMCASFCRLVRPRGDAESILLACHFEEMQAGGRMDLFKTPSAAGINNFRFTALLEEEHLLIPSQALQLEAVAGFRAIRGQLATLAAQVHRLRTARDLLLPQLMSGAISV